MGIFDFLKKKQPVGAAAPAPSADVVSDKPLSNEEMVAVESEAESAPEESPVGSDSGSDAGGDSGE